MIEFCASMSKFPVETVFSKKLSPEDFGDEKSMFANIIRTKWKSNDGNIVYFVRFEFRLNRGSEMKPMCISVTATQLDWIVNCINSNVNHMVIEAEKEGKYISFEKIESLFLSEFAISTIEKKSKFGILLDEYEKSILISNLEIFSFIMKFQQPSGFRLKEIVRLIYCSILHKVMKTQIENNCMACQNGDESEHLCKKENRFLIEKFIDKTIGEKELIRNQFEEYFEYFSKILHIDEQNIIEAKSLVEIISRGEKIDYSNLLNKLFENSFEDYTSKSIVKLMNLKNEESVIPIDEPSTSGSQKKKQRLN